MKINEWEILVHQNPELCFFFSLSTIISIVITIILVVYDRHETMLRHSNTDHLKFEMFVQSRNELEIKDSFIIYLRIRFGIEIDVAFLFSNNMHSDAL